MMEDLLAAKIHQHMRAMAGCSTREEAVQWMAGAYNLLDESLRHLERPKIFSIPGTFGERIFSVVEAPKSISLPPPGFRLPGPVWFQGRTVEYGDRYQNTAWTGRDTRRLEKENARRAAMGLSTKGKT